MDNILTWVKVVLVEGVIITCTHGGESGLSREDLCTLLKVVLLKRSQTEILWTLLVILQKCSPRHG